jgi:hypothetical protein
MHFEYTDLPFLCVGRELGIDADAADDRVLGSRVLGF